MHLNAVLVWRPTFPAVVKILPTRLVPEPGPIDFPSEYVLPFGYSLCVSMGYL